MKSLFLLFLVCLGAIVYSQPTTPILRLENGMHTVAAWRASVDKTGKYILTCSQDKTARLWDATNGQLLRIFRIPIGNTNEGKLYACALSPDGTLAAISGDTGFEWDETGCIYILSTQTGEILHRLKQVPESPMDLKFSPDGKFLAAGLGIGKGVYIYQTTGWLLHKKLQGYQDNVNTIAFDNKNRLATVSSPTNLRLYDNNFALIKEVNLKNKRPYCIAFNPSGSNIAVGYESWQVVEIRKTDDLQVVSRPDTTEYYDGFRAMSFSSDGRSLFAAGDGGVEIDGKIKYVVRKWNTKTGSYKDIPLFKDAISDIKTLPNGDLIIIGTHPEMAMIDEEGNILWKHDALITDLRGKDPLRFKLNEKGSGIGFTPFEDSPLSFDVPTRLIKNEEATYPSPTDKADGITITNWKNLYNPEINGKLFDFIGKNEFSRSVDIDNAGDVIVGTEWNIYKTDRAGQKLWSVAVPDAAWSVKISGNNKVVAASFGDGTIRWFRMTDGKELLAFYLDSDKKRWVLYTPSGYYDASPGAEEILGWHINHGPEKIPSFYPVSRFKEQYYRPDVIDALFETYDEEKAVALADQKSNKKVTTIKRDITQKLPPTITIISPANGSAVSSNTVKVTYSVSSPDDAPLKNLKVLVNGRPVALQRGVEGLELNEKTISVTIPSQDCTITLLAENDNGTSPEANLYIKWSTPVANNDFVYKPKLYVLAIGISDYNNPSYKLGFAAKDAGDFATAISKQKGTLYSDVIIKKLVDKEATKDAITDGLDWIQKQTGQKDVAMIFYAGHGMNDNNGIFYMLPVGADMDRIRTTCLNFEELKQTVSNIAGKVVVLIDACHSGNVMGGRRGESDINSVVNELSNTENGAITFTSSTGKEYSLEDPGWGNGAFTKAVIEGLSGKAAISGKNKITVKSLDAYISERVKELTNGKQHPTSVSPPNVPDFPIGLAP
jgi:WD40 repeat protein